MMMKKQSNVWSRTKVLYLLPIAAVALSAMAAPKLMVNDSKVYDDNTKVYTSDGRKVTYILNGQRVTKAVYEAADKVNEVVSKFTELGVEITVYNAQTRSAVSLFKAPEDGDDLENEVYETCEVIPQFPGGVDGLMNYMRQSLSYPKIAQMMGVQGKILIQFVVDREGNVRDAHLMRHINEDNSKFLKNQLLADVANQVQLTEGFSIEEQVALACTMIEEEALRVVNSMPKWQPGTDKGKPVNVKFTIPITFRLR